LGRKGVVITADLAQSSEAQRAVREAVQSLGKVDILVNNVGGYRLYTNNLVHHLPVAELSEEEWHRVITGNLTTAFLSCKAVLPHMMERRSGVIINLTSHRLAQRGGCRTGRLCRSQGGGGTPGRVPGRGAQGIRHCGQYLASRLGFDQT
ncbi:MAG TPA: SDR family NAD(P)-dependent oxidoreductase, partial [Dehalococcoidia bacterium]|nr:SDR family NAD(P)-dependent oxidoreductase [Dehalococcoidia bacterium]